VGSVAVRGGGAALLGLLPAPSAERPELACSTPAGALGARAEAAPSAAFIEIWCPEKGAWNVHDHDSPD
jgi:hypothetical protein